MRGIPPLNNIPVDIPLHILAPAVLGQSIVTIPEHLAEAGSKILIYLAQILEIPDDAKDLDNKPIEEMIYTMEEMEVLESIDEEEFESAILNTSMSV